MSDNLVENRAVNGDTQYTSIVSEWDPGNTFSFLYPYTTQTNVIKDFVDVANGISITHISNDNPYYNRGAKSAAVTINNRELVGLGWNNGNFNDAKKLSSTTTLVNCVGWAHGRVIEVWDTAVKCGYVKPYGDKWCIPEKGTDDNPYIIDCVNPPSKHRVPACNAYDFYDRWPTGSGWEKTTKYVDDKRPAPGALICWRNMLNTSGRCGHVAFVEAVHNYGQDNEYIIVSQSGYDRSVAKKLVYTQKIYRNSLSFNTCYGVSWGLSYLKFTGFLYSPICQLTKGSYATSKTHYTTEDLQLLEADSAAYERINKAAAASGKEVQRELMIGEDVEIVWFGSATEDDTNSKINLLGGVGKIVSVDTSNVYPYAVSITGDGVISGYFARGSLKALADEV